MNYQERYQPAPGGQPGPMWRPQGASPAQQEVYSPYGGPPPLAPAAPPVTQLPRPDEQFTPGAWFGDLCFVIALLGGVLLLAYTLLKPFLDFEQLVSG